MPRFDTLTSRVVTLPRNDIDTDQIIPARFLKVTTKDGLAPHLFADWRYRDDGSRREDFVLEHEASRGAQILLAGANFGCGSSREHAPWALVAWGFRAVIAPSFADIFKGNALKNGLLPIAIDGGGHAQLLALCTADPSLELRVDLRSNQVALPNGTRLTFAIDAFARHCLLEGVDELGFLLAHEKEIVAYEAASAG